MTDCRDVQMAWPTDVTAIIKTFCRPAHLARLLDSMRRHYCDPRIVVVDDGQDLEPPQDVTYVRLPFDSGLSAGRNAGFHAAETPLVLLLDDDFVFTRKTRIDKLRDSLLRDDFDIVAGNVEGGMGVPVRSANYAGTLEKRGREMIVGRFPDDIPLLVQADHVPNFFMAKTDIIRKVQWNEKLKLLEHRDFFWRVKQIGLRVAYRRDVEISHHRGAASSLFNRYRSRGLDYQALSHREIGIDCESWRQIAYGELTTRSIEVTVRIGCPVACRYCPQDVLWAATSDHSSTFTVDTLRRIIANCTGGGHWLRVDFSGFAEPFSHPGAVDLMQECESNVNVSEIVLYTTGHMMTDDHLAALGKLAKLQDRVFFHVSPAWHSWSRLDVIDKHLPFAKFIHVNDGTSDRQLKQMRRYLRGYGFSLLQQPVVSRAGNVRDMPAARTHSPVTCAKIDGRQSPVVLPDGTTVACCNDWGLELPLGNLLHDRWESLDFQRVRELQKQPESDSPCFRDCHFAKPSHHDPEATA
jgi:GT2 family glycosyltransferase